MKKSARHPAIRPSHPAAIIADSAAETGLSKVALAKALGISRNRLYDLLAERQAVTAAMALRLEELLGSNAETWLNIQQQHDLWLARQSTDISDLRRVDAA